MFIQSNLKNECPYDEEIILEQKYLQDNGFFNVAKLSLTGTEIKAYVREFSGPVQDTLYPQRNIVEVSLFFSHEGMNYYQTSSTLDYESSFNSAIIQLNDRIVITEFQNSTIVKLDRVGSIDNELLFELNKACAEITQTPGVSPLAFMAHVSGLKTSGIDIPKVPHDNPLLELYREALIARLEPRERREVRRSVHRCDPRIATPDGITRNLIYFRERPEYDRYQRALANFIYFCSQRVCKYNGDETSSVHYEEWPHITLHKLMLHAATQPKSAGLSYIKGIEGNKSVLGPLEAQMLWDLLQKLSEQIGKKFGMEINDGTEIPFGTSSRYVPIAPDRGFLKSEIKKLKYKPGREGEEWEGDPLSPDSPYKIPIPRMVAISNSALYACSGMFFETKKKRDNSSYQNGTAVGGRMMRGGPERFAAFFSNHPMLGNHLLSISTHEKLEEMCLDLSNQGFLCPDIVKMDKTLDESQKMCFFIFHMMGYEMPEVWTWKHEKALFLYAYLANNTVVPSMSVDDKGNILVIPTYLASGSPLTTMIGEFYQAVLMVHARLILCAQFEDFIFLSFNYGDDGVIYIDGLPPGRIIDALEATGAFWDIENYTEGQYNSFFSTVNGSGIVDRGVVFLKNYFRVVDDVIFSFRIMEDILPKIFKSSDGVKDVSHLYRRVTSQAFQVGANPYLYELLRNISEDILGNLVPEMGLYANEKKSYIRAAGQQHFPRYQDVLCLQLDTPRHSSEFFYNSCVARSEMPFALFV